ncbi:MAG: Na/Pi symporter [Negativicutes bacterium]|nr:Na/Pi symporter [Negativicutes bacterium]
MDNIAILASGTAMLLGGLFLLRFGLTKLFSPALKQLLFKLTLSPWRGLLAGTVAAALMQSSTAVTLLTIGLVSAAYLPFYQALGLILGANIGTCATTGLLVLSIPPECFLPLAAIGVLVAVLSSNHRCSALAGIGLLSMFAGVEVLSQGLESASELDTVMAFLATAKQNPVYGIFGGILLTFLVQSSSAATGLLMVLTEGNLIDLHTAIYGVYGNNIGSCLFSLIVGVTAPLAARRIAVAHIMLNLLGVLVFFPFSGLLAKTATLLTADLAGQVASVHTLFNLLSSLAALPVLRLFARFITFIVPGNDAKL